MTPQEFGQAREALGLTQAALAVELGLTPRAIKHYDGGTRTIPRIVELAIAALRPRRSLRHPRVGNAVR